MKTLECSCPQFSQTVMMQPVAVPKPPTADHAMIHPVLDAASLIIAMLLGTAGMLAQGQPEPGGIIGNTYLTFVCMAGAGAGGLLYVIANAFTLKVAESSAVRAVKFVASFILGCTFSPWAFDYFHWSQTPANVLGLSTLVGLVGWGVVLTLLPWSAGAFGSAIKTAFYAVFRINPPADPKS